MPGRVRMPIFRLRAEVTPENFPAFTSNNIQAMPLFDEKELCIEYASSLKSISLHLSVSGLGLKLDLNIPFLGSAQMPGTELLKILGYLLI